jgi:hypothetical protein
MKYNGLEILEKKKEKYFNEQQKFSWLSWNYSDYTVIRYFKNKTEI